MPKTPKSEVCKPNCKLFNHNYITQTQKIWDGGWTQKPNHQLPPNSNNSWTPQIETPQPPSKFNKTPVPDLKTKKLKTLLTWIWPNSCSSILNELVFSWSRIHQSKRSWNLNKTKPQIFSNSSFISTSWISWLKPTNRVHQQSLINRRLESVKAERGSKSLSVARY